MESFESTTAAMYSLPTPSGRQGRAIAVTGNPARQSDATPRDQYCPIARQPETNRLGRVVVVVDVVDDVEAPVLAVSSSSGSGTTIRFLFFAFFFFFFVWCWLAASCWLLLLAIAVKSVG